MSIFKLIILALLLLLIPGFGYCQTIHLENYRVPLQSTEMSLYHLESDSIFHERQNIFIARYDPKVNDTYQFTIAYSDTLLKRTSQFGEETNALLALNGSFFDVEKGGSVAYLEFDGKKIAMNRNPLKKWAKTDSLLNGAIVLDKSDNLTIEISKGGSYYDHSDQEKAVLVSGPILLANKQELPLENSPFVNKKHPRSCLCKMSDNSILFIAIDGRSEKASGMNLKELQQFLQRLDCKDAINLDGGGSTTLWLNDRLKKGIINYPSDQEGERPVANILLIKKRIP